MAVDATRDPRVGRREGVAAVIERPPACQIGSSGCHGPASWCDDCGDVGDVCSNYRNCDSHHCPICGQCWLTHDGECSICRDRREYVSRHGDEIERAEMVLLYCGLGKANANATSELRALGNDAYTRPRYILPPTRLHRWLAL